MRLSEYAVADGLILSKTRLHTSLTFATGIKPIHAGANCGTKHNIKIGLNLFITILHAPFLILMPVSYSFYQYSSIHLIYIFFSW